eukprot:1180824-Prorocentrum_minimum.AAC.2
MFIEQYVKSKTGNLPRVLLYNFAPRGLFALAGALWVYEFRLRTESTAGRPSENKSCVKLHKPSSSPRESSEVMKGRSTLFLLFGILLINSILVIVVTDWYLSSTTGKRPTLPTEQRTCKEIRIDVAQRTDRRVLKNGGAYSCDDCEAALRGRLDDGLRSCSQCGSITLTNQRQGNRQGTDFSDDILPDTSTIQWRLTRDKMLNWFVHQDNSRKLGRENLTQETLPLNGEESLEGFKRQHRWETCAVVGSGGNLYQSQLGEEIDSRDVVVRLNQAPCVGYEKHVGSKTDIRLLNNRWTQKYGKETRRPSAAKHSASMPLEDGVMLLLTRSDDEDYERLLQYLQAGRPDVGVRLLSSRVVSSVRDGLLVPFRAAVNETCQEPLLLALAGGRDTPSSGLLSVFIMMHLCEHVSVFGFSGNSKRYHYFKSNRNYMNLTHNFSIERMLLKALARNGLIRFYDDGNVEQRRPPLMKGRVAESSSPLLVS